MKWLVSVLLLVVPIPAVVIAELKSELQQRPLVLTHVSVIDTAGASVQQDMMVVIVGDHIAGVGKAAEVNVPKSAQVIDARGKFLMPGLWDMHVHIFNHVTRRPPNTWYFPLFVANGITSIREMWT